MKINKSIYIKAVQRNLAIAFAFLSNILQPTTALTETTEMGDFNG